MKKLLNKTDIFGALLCLCSMLPGIILYSRIPDKIATHFDINGQPDQYSSKAFAVFGIPLILTALQLFCCIISNRDKRTENAGQLNTIVRFIPGMIGFTCECVILLYALKKLGNIVTIASCLLAVLFIVTGNYLPKVRQNSVIGIKTRRTLSSEVVWHKTHRLAGFTFTLCGIVFIPLAFLEQLIAGLVVIVLAAVIPCIYAHFVKE